MREQFSLDMLGDFRQHVNPIFLGHIPRSMPSLAMSA